MADVVFEINPAEFQALREKLATSEWAIAPAREFIQRSAHQVRTEIVIRTPVDTGRLRSSLAVASRDQGLTAIVGTNVQYAPHVEFGTRPHWPPLSAMQPWAGRHGFPKGKKGAFLVARAISRRGTRARHMFRDGIAAAEPFIQAEAALLLERIGVGFSE
jgi:hypothetical protein